MCNCTHCGERIFVDEGNHVTFGGDRFCCEQCVSEHQNDIGGIDLGDMFAGESDSIEFLGETVPLSECDLF